MLRYTDFPYRDLAISSHQANPLQWGVFRRPENRLSGRVVIGTFFNSRSSCNTPFYTVGVSICTIPRRGILTQSGRLLSS